MKVRPGRFGGGGEHEKNEKINKKYLMQFKNDPACTSERLYRTD